MKLEFPNFFEEFSWALFLYSGELSPVGSCPRTMWHLLEGFHVDYRNSHI